MNIMGGMFLVKFAVNLHLSASVITNTDSGENVFGRLRTCSRSGAVSSLNKFTQIKSGFVLTQSAHVMSMVDVTRLMEKMSHVVALRERPGLHQDSPANIDLHSKVDSVFRDGRSFEGVCINKMSATS